MSLRCGYVLEIDPKEKVGTIVSHLNPKFREWEFFFDASCSDQFFHLKRHDTVTFYPTMFPPDYIPTARSIRKVEASA